MGAIVTPFQERELNKIVERTLRDAGFRNPPVQLTDVLEHLELSQYFYDLSDPSFLDKAKHKVMVGGHRLVEIIRKIKLQAVLFFDEGRIVVDRSLPPLKQVWPAFHEAGHRICPLHKEVFAFGDTAQTLLPEFHEKLEAEANYAGGCLMFCGNYFTRETMDTMPCWATVDAMAERYGRTKTATLRHYVRFGPDHPMAVIIGTPWWKQGGDHEPGSWRHFVSSYGFARQFSNANADYLNGTVNQNTKEQYGGQVASFTLPLADDDGIEHEFLAEAFFNRYDLLMMFVHLRKLNSRGVIVVPEQIGAIVQPIGVAR
jgi:hypothetical protein